MSKPRGGLAFGGAGSGRSNFNSMKVSGADNDGGRPGKGAPLLTAREPDRHRVVCALG